MTSLVLEPATPFSDSDIKEIEGAIGRALPVDYCVFVRKYGGAFVGGLVNGSDGLPILAFMGPDEENGVLSALKTHPDLRSEGILPFADCELGNLYVLDRQNAVHYLNYYNGDATAQKVADSFQDFIERISIPEE